MTGSELWRYGLEPFSQKFQQEVEERDRELRLLKAELERIKAAVGLDE